MDPRTATQNNRTDTHLREAAEEHGFRLGRQPRRDVGLAAAQQVGGDEVAQHDGAAVARLHLSCWCFFVGFVVVGFSFVGFWCWVSCA